MREIKNFKKVRYYKGNQELTKEEVHQILGITEDEYETLSERAYQCAYDLSNDWLKDKPDWQDVQTAFKRGVNEAKEYYFSLFEMDTKIKKNDKQKNSYIKQMVADGQITQGIDEAAGRYAREEYNRKNPATLPDRCIGCYAPLMYAFKAGAEWMANQGESYDGVVIENGAFVEFSDGKYIDLDPTMQLNPCFELTDGEKVIVQIRKKGE